MKPNKPEQSLKEALELLSSTNVDQVQAELESSINAAIKKLKKETRAQVMSAVSLTADEKSELTQIISKLTRKEIEIDFLTDKNLLGGIKVKIGDWLYDASLSSQLERVREIIAVRQ